MELILTPTGLVSEDWDSELRDYVRADYKLDIQSLLEGWRLPVVIEEGVLLSHVFSLLRKLDSGTRQALEALTNSSLDGYLQESTTLFPAEEDSDKLYAVEVYRGIEVHNHGNCETFEVETHVGAHGTGKPWDGPEMEDVPLEKRGNAYAIEFTPWHKLRHLPVVLRRQAFVSIHTWKKLEEKRPLAIDQNGVPLMYTDRDLVKTETPEWETSYSLGDFFYGLLNELAFFSSPDSRDGKHEELDQSFAEVQDEIDRNRNGDPGSSEDN